MDTIAQLLNPRIWASGCPIVSEEWQASSIGIAVTYLVFIMGVPALIFQIFIPEAFRSIYNERVGKKWQNYFLLQIILILILFTLSNQIVRFILPAWLIAIFTIAIVTFILFRGFRHLTRDFDSMRHLEHNLAKKIAIDAITYFDKHQNLNKKDLEDLSLLAKELPAGRAKNLFLTECEGIIEHLLKKATKDKDLRLVGDILKEAVCQSVTYDGAESNQENLDKALALLNLAYGQAHAGSKKQSLKSSYLYTDIITCMKEIGVKAMHKGDLDSVMNVVDDLATIEGASKMMYALGSEALINKHTQTAVTVVKRLGGNIQQMALFEDSIDYNQKMIFYFWLGLVSKIYTLGGSSAEFSERQMNVVVKLLGDKHKDFLPPLFDESKKHFYQQADFAAIDAIKSLEKSLFSEDWPSSIAK